MCCRFSKNVNDTMLTINVHICRRRNTQLVMSRAGFESYDSSESLLREACSRILPRGRSGINVSNSRIEVLACARVARVLQRAADSGLPTGRFFVLVSTLSRSNSLVPPSPPLRLFFFFARRRGRAIVYLLETELN